MNDKKAVEKVFKFALAPHAKVIALIRERAAKQALELKKFGGLGDLELPKVPALSLKEVEENPET